MTPTASLHRRECRVPLRVPILLEVLAGGRLPLFFESVAEEISRSGFRLDLGAEDQFPSALELKRAYRATVTFGGKALEAVIEFVWRRRERCGIRFLAREKGWIIN